MVTLALGLLIFLCAGLALTLDQPGAGFAWLAATVLFGAGVVLDGLHRIETLLEELVPEQPKPQKPSMAERIGRSAGKAVRQAKGGASAERTEPTERAH